MKYFITVFICFIALQIALAQEPVNTTYYVWAKSGLSLREAPDKNAKKITTIPYGNKTTFISKVYEHLTVTEFTNFEYGDIWFKINYDNQIGYAFAGYLSYLKPPKASENYDLLTYLKENFTKVKTTAYTK